MVGEDVVRRVKALTHKHGRRKAALLLGVGDSTLDAARDYGRMNRATYERLMAGLERAEREETAA